jgi:hypothetical protein
MKNTENNSQVTIKGITYNIQAEIKLTGNASRNGFYTSLISLARPKGHKEFLAMRDINNNITLN